MSVPALQSLWSRQAPVLASAFGCSRKHVRLHPAMLSGSNAGQELQAFFRAMPAAFCALLVVQGALD